MIVCCLGVWSNGCGGAGPETLSMALRPLGLCGQCAAMHALGLAASPIHGAMQAPDLMRAYEAAGGLALGADSCNQLLPIGFLHACNDLAIHRCYTQVTGGWGTARVPHAATGQSTLRVLAPQPCWIVAAQCLQAVCQFQDALVHTVLQYQSLPARRSRRNPQGPLLRGPQTLACNI